MTSKEGKFLVPNSNAELSHTRKELMVTPFPYGRDGLKPMQATWGNFGEEKLIQSKVNKQQGNRGNLGFLLQS